MHFEVRLCGKLTEEAYLRKLEEVGDPHQEVFLKVYEEFLQGQKHRESNIKHVARKASFVGLRGLRGSWRK